MQIGVIVTFNKMGINYKQSLGHEIKRVIVNVYIMTRSTCW